MSTAEGDKPIEQVKVGDRVWTRSLDGSGSQLRTVTGLFTKQAEKLLTVTVAGEQVKVTAEHPFLVAGLGWLPAGMLRVGDRLVQRDGRTATIEGVSEAAVSEAVFNFEVEGDHNYYITQAQLLVHNCPIGGGARSPSQALRAVGQELDSVDDIMRNPQLLAGKTPAEVESIIGRTPGWRVEGLGQGGSRGKGWVLRHYSDRGIATGPQIRWHPGGGHHGPDPYWRVVGQNGDLGGIIR